MFINNFLNNFVKYSKRIIFKKIHIKTEVIIIPANNTLLIELG